MNESINSERLVRVETKVDMISKTQDDMQKQSRENHREYELHNRANEQSFADIKESIINLRTTVTAQAISIENMAKKQEIHDAHLRALDSHITKVERALDEKINSVESTVNQKVASLSALLDISRTRIIAWGSGAAFAGTTIFAAITWFLNHFPL